MVLLGGKVKVPKYEPELTKWKWFAFIVLLILLAIVLSGCRQYKDSWDWETYHGKGYCIGPYELHERNWSMLEWFARYQLNLNDMEHNQKLYDNMLEMIKERNRR